VAAYLPGTSEDTDLIARVAVGTVRAQHGQEAEDAARWAHWANDLAEGQAWRAA
jgi:hypothetical protein